MASFIDQVLLVLTTTPGNLTYHLVLTFTIAATLQISLPLIGRNHLPQGRRLVIGLTILLSVRLIHFIAAIFSWQAVTQIPEIHFALLDRAITALSLVIIVWLWAFPEPSSSADRSFGLLGALTLTFLIFSTIWWTNGSQLTPFNSSEPDVLWQTFSIFLIFLGGILLVVRLPVGWGIGLVCMVILFTGHLVHLVSPVPNADYPGIVRLAQLAAYPLLFFLPQRFPLTFAKRQAAHLSADSSWANTALNEATIHSIRDLATENTPTLVYPALTHTIAHLMSSDVCLLLSTNAPEDSIHIDFGYDLIREETIPATSFKPDQIPSLAYALIEEKPLRLNDDETASDQISLGTALNLSHSGPILAVPLLDSSGKAHLSIVLLSPYSNRQWDEEDEDFLVNLTASFTPILVRTRQFQELENHIDQLKQALQDAESRAQKVSQLNKTLITELTTLQENVTQEQSRTESLAALISTHFSSAEGIEDTFDEFKHILTSAPDALKHEQADDGHQSIQEDLQLALEEITHLKASLSAAREHIQELEESSSTPNDIEGRDLTISNIAQELRLPLSSILGYTEVLLTSSTNALNLPQRKLLERIKTSSQRLVGLLEDLSQLAVPQDREVSTQPLSLPALIEETVAFTHQGLRRKKLTLKTDIPGKLPQIQADRNLLRQLIVNLINEAIRATPSGESIAITVSSKDPTIPPDSILLQISDSGPGIPPIELSQVFASTQSPHQTAPDNISDLALSTLKHHFESQGGRVWVDSVVDQGTTYSLLLSVYLPSLLASSDFPKFDEALE